MKSATFADVTSVVATYMVFWACSGVTRAADYAELGFRCQVHGDPKLEWQDMVPRKPKRFMEAGAGWNYVAMDQAIRDAGLEGRIELLQAD